MLTAPTRTPNYTRNTADPLLQQTRVLLRFTNVSCGGGAIQSGTVINVTTDGGFQNMIGQNQRKCRRVKHNRHPRILRENTKPNKLTPGLQTDG